MASAAEVVVGRAGRDDVLAVVTRNLDLFDRRDRVGLGIGPVMTTDVSFAVIVSFPGCAEDEDRVAPIGRVDDVVVRPGTDEVGARATGDRVRAKVSVDRGLAERGEGRPEAAEVDVVGSRPPLDIDEGDRRAQCSTTPGVCTVHLDLCAHTGERNRVVGVARDEQRVARDARRNSGESGHGPHEADTGRSEQAPPPT